MPVSLDEMMQSVPDDRRAAIERNASALADAYRSARPAERRDGSAQMPVVGSRATTGQSCPASGIWTVELTPSVKVPIAIHDLMPPYGNRAVTWVLVEAA